MAETCARGRLIHDADSHLMEDAGWLARYAEPRFRDLIPMLDMHGMEEFSSRLIEEARAARKDPAARSRAEAALMERKNWAALGAFDPIDRGRALDLLGFRSQFVFSTYGHIPLLTLPYSPGITDPDLLYAAVRAHNRGVAEFCAGDDRLLPVAWVSLNDSERAVEATRRALESGCAAVEIPSYQTGPASLTHVDLDPMYSLLEEADLPLLFHVGGGGRLASPVFAANGRAPAQPRSRKHRPLLPALTFMGISAPIEMAVAALIFDGVLERHPKLRCGVIEQGATWVPGFLRRLDLALAEFGGASPELSLAPSEYVLRQVRFTPFPYEDVGWLIDQTSPTLYLFSTDFPHDEGGKAPLESFVAQLDGRPAAEQDMFFWRNFEELAGAGLPGQRRVSGGAAQAVR
jgi:predicted TIM-barrel fold metal-dependent hydrolase